MRPTREQIEVAAYHRWQRRWGVHGDHAGDWEAAERDLTFALNYNYIARHRLRPTAGAPGPVLLGRDEVEGPTGRARRQGRRCRYCERAEPAARFGQPPLALPPSAGPTALVAWDECADCRSHYDAGLAGPFERFARPLLPDSPGDGPEVPEAGMPMDALKGLVRLGLAVMPAAELPFFNDTVEWVDNPDHGRDAGVSGASGCHLYVTPGPVPAPFLALARRSDDEADWPYMLVLLGLGRVVLQAHLPLCPRDDDLEGAWPRGPEHSMTQGVGPATRPSRCHFLSAVGVSRGRHDGETGAGLNGAYRG